jgi:hypothetical protein
MNETQDAQKQLRVRIKTPEQTDSKHENYHPHSKILNVLIQVVPQPQRIQKGRWVTLAGTDADF